MDFNQLVQSICRVHSELQMQAACAVDRGLVLRNWMVGAYLVEYQQSGRDRAKYGTRLLARLAERLERHGVRGLSVQMLERTRQFYLIYPQIARILSPTMPGISGNLRSIRKSSPLVRKSPFISSTSPEDLMQFSWSKIIELIHINDQVKRNFYEKACLEGHWSKRQLQRQIGSMLFERAGLSTRKEAVINRAHGQNRPERSGELFKDPYILEFTGLAGRPDYTENDLEKALLNNLQAFLLELGTGFCFEARQWRIASNNRHYHVDLVFYHRILRCHVLVDLKVRYFIHADAGQMNFYLNWVKNHLMSPGDNPPVGIVLCSDREKTDVEYAIAGMDNRLFVSRYQVALPSLKDLRERIQRDREHIERIRTL